MKKNFCITLLALILAVSVAVPVFAAVGLPDVLPNFQNMDTTSVVINCTAGTVTGRAFATSTTTKLEGTLTLYEKVGTSWDEVDSITESSSSTFSSVLEFDPVSKTEYKAVWTVKAYGASPAEILTKEAYATCP